jgi:DNA-binding response OmpR family regulator
MTRILLIEDNEQLQKYICDYLNAYGFEAHILEDYEAVLETIEKTAPRLVLLDITLPKFDGFYYLRLIRKKYNMPVIIISALNEEGEQNTRYGTWGGRLCNQTVRNWRVVSKNQCRFTAVGRSDG